MTLTAPPRLGQVAQISLFVRDVGAAERFYRDTLGLPHIFTFGDLAFFDLAGIRLYTHAVGAEEWRPSSHIYFLVPDIQVAYEWLREQGVKVKGAPHVIFTDPATGTEEWLAFFEDPDGNGLALMSRVTPDVRAGATVPPCSTCATAAFRASATRSTGRPTVRSTPRSCSGSRASRAAARCSITGVPPTRTHKVEPCGGSRSSAPTRTPTATTS